MRKIILKDYKVMGYIKMNSIETQSQEHNE